MRKLGSFGLALFISLSAVGALAAASAGFGGDFTHVARQTWAPAAPVEAAPAIADGGVEGGGADRRLSSAEPGSGAVNGS